MANSPAKFYVPIVDAQYKADTLIKLAEKLSIPIQQTIAIGDGANDLKMIQAAGLKPRVPRQAKSVCQSQSGDSAW